jgi:hypothetical protein
MKLQGEDADDAEDAEKEDEVDKEDVPKFPKGFIFSCIGVGLTNFARKAE